MTEELYPSTPETQDEAYFEREETEDETVKREDKEKAELASSLLAKCSYRDFLDALDTASEGQQADIKWDIATGDTNALGEDIHNALKNYFKRVAEREYRSKQ